MMNDLISRQAAIDIIIADKIEGKALNIIIALGDGKQAETLNDACDRHAQLLNDLPSAQPEPKTGEWNFVGNQMFECTSCGVAYTEYQFEKMRVRYNDPKFPRFCPNCGARMDDEG